MIRTWQRWMREYPHTIDTVVALLLFGASFPGSMLRSPYVPAPGHWLPGVLLTGAACVALLWRRDHPRVVAVLTAASAIAIAALGYLPTILVHGPLVIALYSLADRTDRRTANSIALPVIALVILAAVIARPHETVDLTVLAPAAALLLPLALGTTTKIRRDYLQAVHARAEYAEQNREQEARRRVAEERMRIARELHDVVAHHLALANAQAGTAAHLAGSRPEQAREILAELTVTTASALRELKATVGLLRQADDPDAPLHPAPGLAQLPALAASLAAAGLTVATETEGEPQPLSPGVDLTAFRIVQEALTNVTKHAATKTAHVRLAYSRDRLTITVTDDADAPAPLAPAPAASGPGGGFGLIGMRERAGSVGGRVRAGHRPEGGFAVTAELPLYSHDPEEEPLP